MQRKIILSLAMSLDGYIATSEGGFDWIKGDGDHSLDTKERWDYAKFLQEVDMVVMGRVCYEQKMHADFSDQKVWVATSRESADHDNVHFINEGIVDAVKEEKRHEGKNIFVFGGGQLVHYFLKDDVIDEYYIGIIPIILGKGKPLFVGENRETKLHLKDILSEEGVVVLHYVKR